MSLRLQLLGAFAYVLLLIIVALEVPLALNLAKRIDAEVKNEAAGQAFARGRECVGPAETSRSALAAVVRRAGSDLGGAGDRGRRARPAARRLDRRRDAAAAVRYALAAGDRGPRSAACARRASATATRSARTCSTRRCPVTNNGRVVGAVRVTQELAAVHDRVRRGVLALIAIGAFALVLGLALAWFLAGSLARPLRSLAGDGAAGGGRRSRGAGRGDGRDGAARGLGGLQRHGRTARDGACGATRVRRQRLAPAAHPADRAAAAARVGARQGRTRRRAGSSRPPSWRSSGSPGCSPRC